MKFKITEIFQLGNNLQVAISHEECEREVFSFPIEYHKNKKYLEEIKIIMYKRKTNKIKIKKNETGKEIQI